MLFSFSSLIISLSPSISFLSLLFPPGSLLKDHCCSFALSCFLISFFHALVLTVASLAFLLSVSLDFLTSDSPPTSKTRLSLSLSRRLCLSLPLSQQTCSLFIPIIQVASAPTPPPVSPCFVLSAHIYAQQMKHNELRARDVSSEMKMTRMSPMTLMMSNGRPYKGLLLWRGRMRYETKGEN